MRQIFAFLILLICVGSCSLTEKPTKSVYSITVIDKNKNSLIDSAKVVLTALIDSRDVYEYVKYTDTYGRCVFSLDNNPLAQYQVRSMKKGFIGYYDESYIDLDRAFSFLNEKSGRTIDLYLTSDTLNQRIFWKSHTIQYDVDTLINLLKSNSYPLRSEFPLLRWEDIPKFLTIGNNNIMINKYPISVASSSVSGNYKCRFSANRNASKSASLISDLQRNKIIKNDNFNNCFFLKISLSEFPKTHPFSFSRSSINCLIRKINVQPSTCQGHVNARLYAQCYPMGTLDRYLAVQRKS